MNKNRLIRSALCLALAFAMTFTPIFSSYAIIASAAGTGEEQATELEDTNTNEEAVQEESTSEPEAESVKDQTQESPKTDEQTVKEEQSEKTEAVEEKSNKTEYVWKDDKVKVTATLADADAIPDDAKLVATAIDKESQDYNYKAYMDALNKDSKTKYDESNTLLYDIAFIKDGVELQPESGKVSVTFDFLDDQLKQSIGAKKAADVNVIHLPLVDKVKDQYDTTADAKDIKAKDINVEEVTKEDNDLKVSVRNEKVIFETESFSTFAYTTATAAEDGSVTVNIHFKDANGNEVTSASIAQNKYFVFVNGKAQRSDGQQPNSFVLKPLSSSASATITSLGENGNAVGPMINGESYTLNIYQLKDGKTPRNEYASGTPDQNDYALISGDTLIQAGSKTYQLSVPDTVTLSSGTIDLEATEAEDPNAVHYGDNTDKISIVNINTVLGRAVEYGILAETYKQTAHTETNWAVNTYERVGDLVTDPDLGTNTADVMDTGYPFIMTKMTNGFRVGTTSYGTMAVYTSNEYAGHDELFVADKPEQVTIKKYFRDKTTLKADVDAMIQKITDESDALYAKTTVTVPDAAIPSNNFTLDVTSYADDDVIYVNVPAGSKLEEIIKTTADNDSAGKAGLTIRKKANQMVVFNFESTGTVNINKIAVEVDGKRITSDTINQVLDNEHNKDVDNYIIRKIIWNANKASQLNIDMGAGMFLVPRGNAHCQNASAGWIASGRTVTANGEWHFAFRQRQFSKDGSIKFEGRKELRVYRDDGTYTRLPIQEGDFKFTLYRTDETYNTTSESATVVQQHLGNSATSAVQFQDLNIKDTDLTETDAEGHSTKTFYYVIREELPNGTVPELHSQQTVDGIDYWTGALKIKIVATLIPAAPNSGGEDEIQFVVSSVKTDSNGTVIARNDNVVATTQVFTFGALPNATSDQKVRLMASKNLVGKTWREGMTFEFKLTPIEARAADGSSIPISDIPMPSSDTARATHVQQAAIFGAIEFATPGVYTYQIQEQAPAGATPAAENHVIYNNINYDLTPHTATVTVTQEGGILHTDVKYDGTNNNLSVTNEAITGGLTVNKHVVTNAQADSNHYFNFRVELSDTSINGTYGEMEFVDGVSEFSILGDAHKFARGLPVGITYTVTEEPTDGYTTSSVGATGTIAVISPQVEFFNTSVGSLKVTKAWDGVEDSELTQEQKESLTFVVKDSDGNVKGQFTYADMPNGSKTLENLPVGTYTVEERGADNLDINGKKFVSTTYSVEGGSVAVSHLNTSEVTVTNKYSEEETGGIKVVKTAQLNETANPGAAGQTFKVALFSDEAGTTKVGEQTITIGNDGTGEATFDGLAVGTTYYVFEMNGSSKAEEGSRIGEYTVVTGSGSAEATVDISNTVNLVNNKNTGTARVDDSVKITKKDQAGAALNGAEFKLYADEGLSTIVDSYTGGSFDISTADETLASYLPTENGGSTTLYLKETAAPAGYNMDTATHPVVITTTIATAYDENQDKYITTTTYEMTIDGASEIDVTNTQKTGVARVDDSVKITKKDQAGAALNGAEFKLYADEGLSTIVDSYTGGSFDISTADETLASYLPTTNNGSRTLYLKETKAPSGYEMDATAHPVVITTSIETAYDPAQDKYITTTTYEMTIDEASEIDVTNTQKTGVDRVDDSVTITKKDQDGAPLGGAEFELYQGTIFKKTIEVETGGSFVISTEDPELAPYLPTEDGGSVTLHLKETKAPEGYDKDTTAHPVVITTRIATDYDATQDKYITTTTYTMTIDGEAKIDVTNTKKTGEATNHDSVKITKKDQAGAALNGATFNLYSDEACTTSVKTYSGGEFSINTNEPELANYLPTENGGSRTLYLKETAAPAGYAMDTVAHPVVITTTIATAYDAAQDKYITTTTYEMTIDSKSEIDVTNTKKTGEATNHDDVTITKKDQDGDALNGATFNLYSDAACTTSVKAYSGGEFTISTEDTALASYLPTTNNGSTTLYLKETAAPAGYNMDTAAHPVVITTTIATAYDSTQDKYITTTTYEMTIDEASEIDVTNTKKTDVDKVDDSVTITKKDQDGAALSGAEFKLYAEEGLTNVVGSYVGGSFTISTEDTALASYLPTTNNGSRTLYLKETKAPAGYEMDTAAHPVTITAAIATAYNEQKDAFVTTTTYTMKIDGKSEIDVTNTKKSGETTIHDSVTITKKDQDGESLSGAEFELYKQGTIFKKTIEVETGGSFVISTEDPELAPYLPTENSGTETLYLKETKAPAGYNKDTTEHPVVITTAIATAYDAAQDKYITTTTYTMTIDNKSAIDVTNTQKTGVDRVDNSVTITKKDQDGAALNGATFNLYSDADCTASVKEYSGGEFTISTEDTALASYLPTANNGSTTLYLKETAAPANYEMDQTAHPVTITTSIVTAYNAQKDAFVTTTTYSISIDSSSSASIFNNRETGELEVTKTVVGKDTDRSKTFNFVVTLDDETINTTATKTYGDMEFVNGVANISLRDGQSMTASNLPTGVGYTVVETLNDDSCMLVKSGDTGTISKETKSVARFKNCFAYGEIQFSGKKTFEHGDISKTPFSFTLYKTDGNNLTPVETVTSKADGTIEFTKLEYTLADLKNGTSYDTTKVFNYVIKEVIPDTADDTGYDAAADIQYDTTAYPVAVTVTRNDTAALSVTADKQTTRFNFANSKKYTYLKLTKNTPELVGGDTNGEVDYVNATMVFRVTYDEVVGTDKDGKDIIKSMTRYVDVAYKASTKKAQVRYLDKIPYGATVTVEEVYSGNYSPDGNKAKYDKDEGCYTVTFNNTLNRSVNGSGVINKISKNGDKWKIVNRITNSDEDPQQPPGGNDQQPKNDQALPQTGEQEVNTEEDDGEE